MVISEDSRWMQMVRTLRGKDVLCWPVFNTRSLFANTKIWLDNYLFIYLRLYSY